MTNNDNVIRKTETPPNNGIRKRFDTSGRATAELISELQKRSISKDIPTNENEG